MNRIQALDGLRGVAILLVCSFHYINNQLLEPSNLLEKILSKSTYFGWIGVDLFFVLSGFLIGTIVLANVKKAGFFKAFFLRRFLRIVPNYFLLIIFFIILSSIHFFDNNLFLFKNNTIPLWAYLAMCHNFFMAQTGMGSAAMSVTWSIGIEEQFYIVFPFIVFLAPKNLLPYILILFFLSAAWFRYQAGGFPANYVLPYCRMDALASGVFVAWLSAENDIQQLVRKRALILKIIFLLIFGVCAYLYLTFGDLGVYKQSFFSVLFTIILLFTLTSEIGLLNWFLTRRWLVLIGMISYPLYLFHYIILGVVHHLGGNNYIGIQHFSDVILSIFAFGISIVISWFLYKNLETPLLNWGRKFSYR